MSLHSTSPWTYCSFIFLTARFPMQSLLSLLVRTTACIGKERPFNRSLTWLDSWKDWLNKITCRLNLILWLCSASSRRAFWYRKCFHSLCWWWFCHWLALERVAPQKSSRSTRNVTVVQLLFELMLFSWLVVNSDAHAGIETGVFVLVADYIKRPDKLLTLFKLTPVF